METNEECHFSQCLKAGCITWENASIYSNLLLVPKLDLGTRKEIAMKELVEKALKKAIDTLIRADFELLQLDVNERSISHRFAKYLEPYFPGWNIDCEYNRNHHDSKRLNISRRNISSDDTEAITVFPDIIVHRRNTDKNLVVIEMKKTSSQEGYKYDLGKLKAFKAQLHYQFAIFIKIKTGQDFGIEPIEWI